MHPDISKNACNPEVTSMWTRKIIVEASEGPQQAQRVSECMHEVGRCLQLRTSTDVEKALEILEETLLISSYSEKLLTMKGEALLMLEKYEAAIKLCEQTVDLAGKNSLPDSHDTPKDISFRIWLCHLMLKSYFYMGKLEEAIASLEKQEQLLSATKRDGNKTLESSIPLAGLIRELLCLKSAGNEAFQSGRHTEAVEHYTAALACNVESRPITAVCFCKRAAAYKALGQFSDAIADCSLAIALDKNYLKAMAIIPDFMLVYLPAPTVSLPPPLALTAGGISKFFHNCPDNAFQIALSGTSYTLLQRLGAITRNGAKLFAVGTTSSLVGTAITNAFIKARRAVDQSSESEIETVPIVSTSVAYGVYMAVSSNLRHQVVAGV